MPSTRAKECGRATGVWAASALMFGPLAARKWTAQGQNKPSKQRSGNVRFAFALLRSTRANRLRPPATERPGTRTSLSGAPDLQPPPFRRLHHPLRRATRSRILSVLLFDLFRCTRWFDPWLSAPYRCAFLLCRAPRNGSLRHTLRRQLAAHVACFALAHSSF